MEENKLEPEKIKKDSKDMMKEDENIISEKESLDKNSNQLPKNKSKKKKVLIIVLIVLILIIVSIFIYKRYFDKPVETTSNKTKAKEVYSKYRMSGNGLEDFDLSFLQLENKTENSLYSPLSIKYALQMLAEGASGNSKAQIDSVIGKYKSNKYVNSQNMSFANAMFINSASKDKIKNTYTSNLVNKYNAEVIFDSFESPNNVNSWVSDKTLGLISNLLDDISNNDYLLVNALAIDMEWNRMLQSDGTVDFYSVSYPHEKYETMIKMIGTDEFSGKDNYDRIRFNDSMDAKSVEVGASINNYDIIKELGEENIRKTVGDGYQKWLNEGNTCGNDPDVNTFLDQYMSELSSNYKRIDVSTDFSFYDDENIKVFSKDLKEYNNTTLQYIGIMPKTVELTDYISKTNAKEINDIINKVKPIKLDSFEYGKVYKLVGNIPLFKFDYELDLMSDLNKLGIKDIFHKEKADLSNLTKDSSSYIDKAVHKANIEFSNYGIKASAVTTLGGLGSTSCGYDYIYDIPVETIDITFNKPYLFLIRDKVTGEVWFSGKVYQPITD